MSYYLWKYYFEDDLDSFRGLLATATFSGAHTRTAVSSAATSTIAGSPGRLLATSPLKSKSKGGRISGNTLALTRADLNARDSRGLTLLHHIASSSTQNASSYALALLQAPMLDLYVQDQESGWTSLHRALYFGNIAIVRALMARDIKDAVSTNASNHAGGLIKIKDKEGNAPFDVYNSTITSRTLQHGLEYLTLSARGSFRQDDTSSEEATGEDDFGRPNQPGFAPAVAIDGDELYLFGSNKNFNLGFGDEDDRHFPERPPLKRPTQLVKKFYQEHSASMTENALIRRKDHMFAAEDTSAFVKFMRLSIFDVQLAKFHSAVLTTDPEANLYTCGYGSAGRLGTGDVQTRFTFTSITGGGLAHKKIIAVALGQDHTLVVTKEGELYSWGSNANGQLGYAQAKESLKEDDRLQLSPRQIFGMLKREIVIGCAASRTHSVVHTGASLYTFGKNDGQLGLVDADARSLEMQAIPRRVAASLFSSAIVMVSAIDKATICLLENHDVWVFANYGYSKVQFDLDGFSFQLARNSFFGARRTGLSNHVVKVCSAGSTICALSSEGAVFTLNLKVETTSSAASTTNPVKIRAALSKPQELWSLRKSSMAAVDVDVGQDGSVIICTAAGSVWKREKRAKVKDTSSTGRHAKDYKFSRIPGLTRAVAVRSNAFGAFAAVRRDCDVLRTQVPVEPSTLWKDIFGLLPFRGLAADENSDVEEPMPRLWAPKRNAYDPALIRRAVMQSKDIEADIRRAIDGISDADMTVYDVKLGTSLSDLRIPCHAFLLAARSEPLRKGLQRFAQEYFFYIHEILSIEYDKEGQAVIIFQGIDVISLLNLIFYIYTDAVMDVWQFARKMPKMAYAYRQVRTEVMKLAAQLDLKGLERATRLMSEPSKQLHKDLDRVVTVPEFFETGDIEVEVDREGTRKVHGALICQRCPFFEGLFHGRAAGGWLSSRRDKLGDEPISIDLKHVNPETFDLVVRYIYADVGVEVFEDASAPDLDTFLDQVLDIMAVANELMLDRLSQVCQEVLGRYVNTRNVCQILNAVAPCSVKEFKNAALEYICLNLEGMLENGLLDELDEDLMEDLNEMVRENQLTTLPIAKSNIAEEELLDRNPELAANIERGRQIKIDSMSLQSRLHEDEARAERLYKQASKSPMLVAKTSLTELVFDMEDDSGRPSSNRKTTSRSSEMPQDEKAQEMDTQQPTTPLRYGISTFVHDDEEFLAMSPTVAMNSLPALSLPSPGASVDSQLPSSHHMAVKAPVDSSSPWSKSSFSAEKLDMKQIMAQASETQSNISARIAGASSNSGVKSGAGAKVSQKERKRQHQQQRQQAIATDMNAGEAPVACASPSPARSSHSPWQIAPAGPTVSLTEMLSRPHETRSPSPSANKARRSPSLTLRQTVPGNIANQRKASADAPKPTASPQPKRSVSQPITSSISSSTTLTRPPAATSSSSSTLTPRSIRHTTSTPAEPSLQLSLADILQQQQSEKDILKEAVAKRSLAEIQEEQAFQEWWDQEEKATKARMEAEEAAAAAKSKPERGNKRGGSGSAGRGGSKSARGRGKRGDRGDAGHSKPVSTAASTIETASGSATRPSRRARG